MNLDELRTVQSKERRKDSLQQLRDSFYGDVAAYIQDLKASRDRRAKQVDDPFSDNEVRRLSDELETAEEVAEAVYERRVGKVVKLASFAAADMPVDDEGMTGEERELFEDLVARIGQNKQAVLDVLSGNTKPDTPSEPTASPASPTERVGESAEPPETDSMLAEAMGAESADTTTETATATAEPAADPVAGRDGDETTEPAPPAEVPPPEADPEPDAVLGTSTDGGRAKTGSPADHDAGPTGPADPVESAETGANATAEPSAESETESLDSTEPAGDDSERTTVRITKNVGEIFGVDGREYTLRSEDVVTLPTANAEPLVERDAALQLD